MVLKNIYFNCSEGGKWLLESSIPLCCGNQHYNAWLLNNLTCASDSTDCRSKKERALPETLLVEAFIDKHFLTSGFSADWNGACLCYSLPLCDRALWQAVFTKRVGTAVFFERAIGWNLSIGSKGIRDVEVTEIQAHAARLHQPSFHTNQDKKLQQYKNK